LIFVWCVRRSARENSTAGKQHDIGKQCQLGDGHSLSVRRHPAHPHHFRPASQQPLADGIQAATVHRDRFVLALPAACPQAAAASIRPAQLRDYCFVLPEQEAGTFEVARRGRFPPRLGPRPGTLAAVLACVSLGGNVAVVPHTLADCNALPGVVYRTIGGQPIASEIAIAFRKYERAPAVNAFLQFARDLKGRP
jgi:hypothetical protein